MSQKLQFVTTVLHEPKLIILDEPFSGLDPVNTNLIKDEILQSGKKRCYHHFQYAPDGTGRRDLRSYRTGE